MEATIKKIDGYELSTFVKKLLPIDKFIFMNGLYFGLGIRF